MLRTWPVKNNKISGIKSGISLGKAYTKAQRPNMLPCLSEISDDMSEDFDRNR